MNSRAANNIYIDFRYIRWRFDKWSATYTYDVGQRSKSKSDSGLDLCESYRAQNGVYDGIGTEPKRRLRTELQAPVHKSFDNWLRTLLVYDLCVHKDSQ